jgi:nucleoside-diphosphate-sugar epimerase
MKPKKILIIGGKGFIGREILNRLKSDGNEIVQMSRTSRKNIDYTEFNGDIANPQTYENFISDWKPNVIIQAAWITNHENYRSSHENIEYSKSTVNLSEFGFKNGIEHFICLGSSAEYGKTTEPCNASRTIANPEDLYGKMKLETFHKIKVLSDQFSKRFTWARIFQPYGPGQDDKRFIPAAINSFKANKEFKCNSPNTILDWITTRDIANGVYWSLENELSNLIDLGTGKGFSLRQVLEELTSIIDLDSKLMNFNEKNDLVHATPLIVSKDSPLLKNGWVASDNLQSGLRWTLGL